MRNLELRLWLAEGKHSRFCEQSLQVLILLKTPDRDNRPLLAHKKCYRTIVKIESGDTENPTINTVKKIADAFGVSLDKLVEK